MRDIARKQIKYLTLAASIIIGLPVSSGVTAENNSQTLLMLDYSRSMWSQSEGKPRYQIARDTLIDTLVPHEGKLSIGVIGYGFKSPPSCTDSALLHTPQPLNTSAIGVRLKKLKPNGRAPLTRAMVIASKALEKKSSPGHLILITDGFDNCSGNPCTQARHMFETNPEVKIHVIAFGASIVDQGRLACINQHSKGRFFNVTNQETLAQALKTTLALAAKPGNTRDVPATPPIALTPPLTPAPTQVVSIANPPATPTPTKVATVPVPLLSGPVPKPRIGPKLVAALKLAILNAVPIPRDPPRGRPEIAVAEVKPAPGSSTNYNRRD